MSLCVYNFLWEKISHVYRSKALILNLITHSTAILIIEAIIKSVTTRLLDIPVYIMHLL